MYRITHRRACRTAATAAVLLLGVGLVPPIASAAGIGGKATRTESVTVGTWGATASVTSMTFTTNTDQTSDVTNTGSVDLSAQSYVVTVSRPAGRPPRFQVYECAVPWVGTSCSGGTGTPVGGFLPSNATTTITSTTALAAGRSVYLLVQALPCHSADGGHVDAPGHVAGAAAGGGAHQPVAAGRPRRVAGQCGLVHPRSAPSPMRVAVRRPGVHPHRAPCCPDLALDVGLPCAVRDLAGGDVRRGEGDGCPFALVVMGHRPAPPSLHGQTRMGAVQWLDLNLLVEAEGVGLRRGGQMATDELDQLLVELRVVGGLEGIDLPRLELVVAPGAGYRVPSDLHSFGDPSCRPVCGSAVGDPVYRDPNESGNGALGRTGIPSSIVDAGPRGRNCAPPSSPGSNAPTAGDAVRPLSGD